MTLDAGRDPVSRSSASVTIGEQRLYEACGLVVEGILRAEFLLDGFYVDDILMARYLVPQS